MQNRDEKQSAGGRHTSPASRPPLKGKTAVITGASDGIGAAAAHKLKELGAEVVVIGRSPEKTRNVADRLGCRSYTADFTSLDEVHQLAEKLKSSCTAIHVLVNNAGGIFGKREITVDNHEKTFQINHLAHFLLTCELLDLLKAGTATVINTSSIAHRIFSRFDITDLELEHRYSAHRAYGNAKLANILFTRELQRRFGTEGISAAAFHPGNVATGFAGRSTSPLKFVYHTPLRYLAGLIPPEKGADTLIWLASTRPDTAPGTDPEADPEAASDACPDAGWEPGGYFYKKKAVRPAKKARDPKLAEQLWDISEKMVSTYLHK